MDFVPAEELVRYSAMTGQSLYYLGEHDLAHKVLAIAEEEGAERASYVLKLLQSEGELSIAVRRGRTTRSGRLVTHPYRVQGPTVIFSTTTATEIDEELTNRCVVLTVDEDREQTRAIHDRQRRAQTLDGILAIADRDPILKVHRDAQRLLEPVEVVNPHAHRLTFADGSTRTRRDHVKYLTLIRAIALLHQHQRERRTATTGRADGDLHRGHHRRHRAGQPPRPRGPGPLPRRTATPAPPTPRSPRRHGRRDRSEREIDRDRVRFTRRQVRERLGGGDTQLKKHLARLVDLELVWCHRAEQTGGFVYELALDRWPRPPGSCPASSTSTTSASRSHPPILRLRRRGIGRPERSRGRGVVGPRSQGGRPPVGTAIGPETPGQRAGSRRRNAAEAGNACLARAQTTQS